MKPVASISLDLDNKWSYLKTHGNPAWQSYPSYFDIFIPYIASILDRHDLKITFFIVGKDASMKSNHEYLKLLTDKGHEVANHSFGHDPAIHSFGRDKIRKEILDTEEHIYSATGQKALGFRSPGFSWNRDLIEVLAECDYSYDASVFPTFIAPLARYYFFSGANLNREEKKKLSRLYGSFLGGFRSAKPYSWVCDSGKQIYEIPVTTFPALKVPIHFTYLLFLSKREKIMYAYLKYALLLCNRLGTGLSFLLHPTDLLDSEQVPELSFCPGMDISRSRKKEIFDTVLQIISERFTLVNMSTHLEYVQKTQRTRTVRLS